MIDNTESKVDVGRAEKAAYAVAFRAKEFRTDAAGEAGGAPVGVVRGDTSGGQRESWEFVTVGSESGDDEAIAAAEG